MPGVSSRTIVGVAVWEPTGWRATGSGAGCGRHWPLCNGEVLPRAPRIQTVIELSHRVSSWWSAPRHGAILLVWSPFAFLRGHGVRRGATVAMAFMGPPVALLGAGLVLFEPARRGQARSRAGVSVSLHLVNTFLLLAATATTAWWASGGARVRLRGEGAAAFAAWVPLFAMLWVGASGAVTALGDTLFPPSSLAAGLAQDVAAGAHLFVRLRALHPVLAVLTAGAIFAAAGVARALRPAPAVRRLSYLASALVLVQVGAGLLDVVLLAPMWLQLAHVSLAYGVWITLVLLAAASLGAEPQAAREGTPETVAAPQS